MDEIWKPVVGYEWLYEVSSKGRIKSLKFWRTRILKPWRWKAGHSHINLHKNKIEHPCIIHRIVAINFIQNPDNLPCVLHKDETLNENWLLYNWYDNLFWGTNSDNMKDMWSKGRQNNNFINNPPHKWKFWKDNISSIKVNQYSLEWIFIKTWYSIADVTRELWISRQSIRRCCTLRYKKAGWFIWKYT